MKKLQTTLHTAIGIIFFTTLYTLGSGWNGAEAASSGTNMVPGGKCVVTKGPNKGKKGTYSDDGWCEGDWGGTECGKSKCKDAAIRNSSLGDISVINSNVTHQVYETIDKDVIRCTTTSQVK